MHLVEAYLLEAPGLAGDPEAVLDLVYQERLLRSERGEEPRLEEYLDRFPHLARQLQVQFELDRAFQQDHLWNLTRPGVPAHGLGPAGSSAQESSSPPGYEILKELGRGGMGIAYQAWQIGLKRLVALKMIQSGALSGSIERARFRTEAAAIGRLQHPNIVQVFEVGEHAGQPFLALEYIDGGSLAEHLDGTPRPAREAASLVEILARAIDYAHRRGVIHRDLKPSNILLAVEGGGWGVGGEEPSTHHPSPSTLHPPPITRRRNSPPSTRRSPISDWPSSCPTPRQLRRAPASCWGRPAIWPPSRSAAPIHREGQTLRASLDRPPTSTASAPRCMSS
jgi:serine/threonine protein kinase